MQWQEELIRNAEGKVYKIKTTYPNNTNRTIQLIKDSHGKLEIIDYV